MNRIKRLLSTLSANDYSIIKSCNDMVKLRFRTIGAFVAFVFLICFSSSFYAFKQLFQNIFIGGFVGIFFAIMITNIYLLIIYTLDRNSFPENTSTATRFSSVLIRVGFVCFMAVIISKPLETLFFSNILKNEVRDFKENKLNSNIQIIEDYYNVEIAQFNHYIKSNPTNAQYYSNQIRNLELSKQKKISSIQSLIEKSNYFFQSIKLLNKNHKVCWLITLVMILIFVSPIYLKNYMSIEHEEFYEKKKYIELRLVNDEYEKFKLKYHKTFNEKFQKEFEYSEVYMDAPFNTIRKTDSREFFKEDDLISEIYNV